MKINLQIDLECEYVYREGEDLAEEIRRVMRERIEQEICGVLWKDKELQKIITEERMLLSKLFIEKYNKTTQI